MYQDFHSTETVHAQQLNDRGYSLNALERARIDKRHRVWAVITIVVCLSLLALLAFYPAIARVLG